MQNLFRTVFLGVWIAITVPGIGGADSPLGGPLPVETAGLSEPDETTSLKSTPPDSETPVKTITRARLLTRIEATDPTAWLLRFGRVETRPLPKP